MGRSDSPLTEAGLAGAKALARILKDEAIGTLLSSPLGRAFSTASIYAEALGLPVLKRDGMAELSSGEWEGKARHAAVEGGGLLRNAWEDRPPGGESYRDAEERVRKVITEIRDGLDKRTILVVGHAGINRVFLKLWLDLPPESALQIECLHEMLYCFEPDGQVTVKFADGRAKDGLFYELGL